MRVKCFFFWRGELLEPAAGGERYGHEMIKKKKLHDTTLSRHSQAKISQRSISNLSKFDLQRVLQQVINHIKTPSVRISQLEVTEARSTKPKTYLASFDLLDG